MKTDSLRTSIYATDSKKLREILKNRRQKLGFSIRGLAEKLQIHHSIIGKIETGDRQLTVLEFIKYCQILKISPDKIIKEIITIN
jgi:transcriptional regulator with XRE-family HTH domain